jgi:hypothetical protein
VDGIQGVLDGDALEVPRRHFQPQWEVEVNLLDRRRCEELLEDLLVLNCRRGGVDLPVTGAHWSEDAIGNKDAGVPAYHPVPCVSLATWSSIPWASEGQWASVGCLQIISPAGHGGGQEAVT